MSARGEHMYNEYNYGSVESTLYCKVVFWIRICLFRGMSKIFNVQHTICKRFLM